MNLFDSIVPQAQLHPIYRMLSMPRNAPERAVVAAWASGFVDRDGKFVQEFQRTFESSFWELYVHAVLREYGMTLDWSHEAPDFVVTGPLPFSVEATIAAPPQGGALAYGVGRPEVPEDLNAYNAEATLRLCNSLDAKLRRYRDRYGALRHVSEKPFVVAIAPFDRPLPHLAANRPIVSALYGQYFDEEASLAGQTDQIIQYPVDRVLKPSGATVPLGLFTSPGYREISAVLYSPLATWGKLRALSDDLSAPAIFTSFHPSAGCLFPEVRATKKNEYREHLLDGLYIFHNPYAEHPISRQVFNHPRVMQFFPDSNGNVHAEGPTDFLLLRSLIYLEGEDDATTAK